jgi:Zn-dependent protease
MSFKVIEIAVQLAVIFFAISFHESAHAWVALKFGDPTARDLGRISLNPLHHIDPFGTVILPILCILLHAPIFGYAKPTPVNLRNVKNARLANFWVSAAGPCSNLLVVAASAAALMLIRVISPETVAGLLGGVFQPGVAAPIAFILLQLIVINLILGVFNLIPVPPMDGSGILFSLLGRRGLRLELFFHRYSMIMFLVIIVLMNVGFFGMILRPVLNFVIGMIARGLR